MTTRTTFLAPILSIGLTGAVALVSVGLIGASAQEALKGTPDQQVSNIRMDVDGTAITATLDDNATARDFASLLPMTLSLEDYNATEKISDLPRRLFTEGAPAGSDPSVEDITYYAPWGNLALFYRDFGCSRGLVRLGKIDAGIEALRRPGPLNVTIELLE